MKQLLFTFFAIVFCYSLFFDNEPKPSVVDELNYIYEDASPNIYVTKDTLCSYATYTYSVIHNEATDKNMKVPFRIY